MVLSLGIVFVVGCVVGGGLPCPVSLRLFLSFFLPVLVVFLPVLENVL
jgi:hypothetical protein